MVLSDGFKFLPSVWFSVLTTCMVLSDGFILTTCMGFSDGFTFLPSVCFYLIVLCDGFKFLPSVWFYLMVLNVLSSVVCFFPGWY